MAKDNNGKSRGGGGRGGRGRRGGGGGGRGSHHTSTTGRDGPRGGHTRPHAAAAAKGGAALPANWPPQITYLTTPVYAGIAPQQRQQLQTQPGDRGDGAALPLSEVPPILRFGPSPLVEIRFIADPTHPACGQRGLFAARHLPAGSFILPYLGVYHRGHVRVSGGGGSGGATDESDYDLWLDRAADVAVDAAGAGNEARFVNDYRGTGKPRPNAEFREVWDPRRGERGMAVFVLPAPKRKLGIVGGGGGAGSTGIAKGEEILVSYGKGFWEMRQKEEKEKKESPKETQQEMGHDEQETTVDVVASALGAVLHVADGPPAR